MRSPGECPWARSGWRVRVPALVVALGLMWPAAAQDQPGAQERADPLGAPSEYGVRFTPGMARIIGRTLTREVLIERYGMDPAKLEPATEALARRFMAFAHQHEEVGQELLENLIVQGLEMDITNRREGYQGLSMGLAKELAGRMPAMMPAIREGMMATVEEIRPLLPLKGQLQMTGEVALANVALDAFEKNLADWSKGELRPFDDPFQPPRVTKKDEQGETPRLKSARAAAERAGGLPVRWMQAYLDEAKKYYQFDAAQSTAGDSLLREYTERMRAAVGGEESWRKQAANERFWMDLAMELPGRWYHPVCARLWQRFLARRYSLKWMDNEFVDKVDAIATEAQRQAAEDRVLTALKAKGYAWESRPTPAAVHANQAE